jgi:hypothetical protein
MRLLTDVRSKLADKAAHATRHLNITAETKTVVERWGWLWILAGIMTGHICHSFLSAVLLTVTGIWIVIACVTSLVIYSGVRGRLDGYDVLSALVSVVEMAVFFNPGATVLRNTVVLSLATIPLQCCLYALLLFRESRLKVKP